MDISGEWKKDLKEAAVTFKFKNSEWVSLNLIEETWEFYTPDDDDENYYLSGFYTVGEDGEIEDVCYELPKSVETAIKLIYNLKKDE